jgi:stage III sporulation protein AB
MQLKLIGSICIIAGCGGFGLLLALQQTRRIGLLRNLISIINSMECELSYRGSPLPHLCRISAQQNQGKIREVFLSLADEMESQVAPDPERCMAAALVKTGNWDTVLKDVLIELGANLGRFDMEGQLRGLEKTRETCSQLLNGLMENKNSRLRSYQTLGFCAGAAIAILLI